MKGSADHQTRSFLMQRFEEIGARPKTKYGQNFLIDLNLQDLLLRSARLTKRDVVLEVGTGTGALTVAIAGQAAAAVTVQVDSHPVQLAEDDLVEFDTGTAAGHAPATINPQVPCGAHERDSIVAFSLSVYNIATPIISLLCDGAA